MSGRQLWLGLTLVAAAWAGNWGLSGVRTAYLFFPLWLGYVLTVDGLVLRLRGDSLLSRSPRGFALLFCVSSPAWWLFELVNLRLGNWEYVGREHFSDLAYAFWCSLSFSTVMPAVFETAELVRGLGFVERRGRGPEWRAPRHLGTALAASGAVALVAMLAWPAVLFPSSGSPACCSWSPCAAAWAAGRCSRRSSGETGVPSARSALARSSAASSGRCGT